MQRYRSPEGCMCRPNRRGLRGGLCATDYRIEPTTGLVSRRRSVSTQQWLELVDSCRQLRGGPDPEVVIGVFLPASQLRPFVKLISCPRRSQNRTAEKPRNHFG